MRVFLVTDIVKGTTRRMDAAQAARTVQIELDELEYLLAEDGLLEGDRYVIADALIG